MLDPLSLFYAFARSLAPFRSRLCNSHLPPLLSETSIFLTKTLFFPSQTLIKPHHSDRFTLSAADVECLPPIPTFLSATSCRPMPPWGTPPTNPIVTDPNLGQPSPYRFWMHSSTISLLVMPLRAVLCLRGASHPQTQSKHSTPVNT